MPPIGEAADPAIVASARFPDLEGISVFVTGGGSGIGAALVEGFLRQGARVAFADLADSAAFAAEMGASTGTEPLWLPCDVTDIVALRGAIDCAAEAHGTVTCLVSNAASDRRHGSLEVDERLWDAALAVNLKHVFFAAQAVVPGMRAAGGGVIVNLSSVSYMMGLAGMPAYIAAKSGINGLTRALAREFGPDRIRVNALAPGWVMTDRQRALWVTDEGLADHLARQCLPDPLVPGDMVGPCLFLASRASGAMTGQALVIDGGVVVTG